MVFYATGGCSLVFSRRKYFAMGLSPLCLPVNSLARSSLGLHLKILTASVFAFKVNAHAKQVSPRATLILWHILSSVFAFKVNAHAKQVSPRATLILWHILFCASPAPGVLWSSTPCRDQHPGSSIPSCVSQIIAGFYHQDACPPHPIILVMSTTLPNRLCCWQHQRSTQ